MFCKRSFSEERERKLTMTDDFGIIKGTQDREIEI